MVFPFGLALLLLSLAGRAGANDCADGQDVCEDSFLLQMRQNTALRQAAVSENTVASKEMVERCKVRVTPQSLLTCETGNPVTKTPCLTKARYEEITTGIYHRMAELVDKETAAPVWSQFAGCVLRMAGHDFMDYKSGEGGSDGCTDMDDDDNAGLAECLTTDYDGLSVLQEYQLVCTELSLADFFVVLAQAVMAKMCPADGSHRRDLLFEAFKNRFKFGRTTRDEDCAIPCRILPNPDGSCDEVERVFVNNLGLTWRYATALSGVHTIGSASVENSGFQGFWATNIVDSARFNNQYYVSLLASSWCPEVVAESGKHQWRRCEQVLAKQTDDVKNQMMLNTDMCLAYTAPNGVDVISAEDTPCCGWVHTGVEDYRMGDAIRTNDLYWCGKRCPKNEEPGTNNKCYKSREEETRICCAGDHYFELGAEGALDCGTPGLGGRPENHHRQGKGELTESNAAVLEFASNSTAWIEAFIEAWFLATEKGQTGLSLMT